MNKHSKKLQTKKDKEEIAKKGAVVREVETIEPQRIKIDLHCHTEASWDSVTSIEKIPDRLVEQGIKVQAITDHNEVNGAFRLKQLVEKEGYDLQIVIGEEVLTTEGEIIGLFLKEKINSGLTPEDTVKEIKKQGGVVLLPHGFDNIKRSRLSDAARERIKDDIDIVETFNTRVTRRKYNKRAFEWAKKNNKLMSAGSDAHTLNDIGTAWIEVNPGKINSADDLKDAIKNSIPTGTWVNPLQSLAYRGWDVTRNILLSIVRQI